MPMPGGFGSFNASTTGQGGTASRNPYFDPNSSYGRPGGGSDVTAPSISGPTGYLESNPRALYTRHTAQYGGGTDPFSQYVQQQYQRIRDAYEAASATNQQLTMQQYLGGITPQLLQNQFRTLSPFQRGRNDAMFGAGPVRTISGG